MRRRRTKNLGLFKTQIGVDQKDPAPTLVTVNPSMSRQCTQAANVVASQNVARDKLERKFGTIKAHTITIAEKHAWNEGSFVLSKADLRTKYGIDRKNPGSEVFLPKFEFLNYLKTLCHQNVYQI